jgi:two-component system OmpR family sensor kinase
MFLFWGPYVGQMREPIRVLYVADRSDTDGTAPRALERVDPPLAVEAAETGEALDRLGDGFDCVVVGDLSGIDPDLLAAVSEESPDLPVVTATGGHDGTHLAERVRTAVGVSPAAPETQIRFSAETFPDIAFYVDEEGRYVDIIAGSESPLLYDRPDVLVGERLQDVLPADIGGRLYETISEAFETGEVQSIQYPLEVQAGLRWFEARIAPTGTTHGDRRHALVVARDITDQKEREQALEALHEMATTIQAAETVEEACELTVTAAADILEFEMCSVIIRDGDWLVPYAVSESAQPDGARTMHVEEGMAGKTFQTGESYVVDQVRPDDETSPALDAIESGLSVPIGEYGVFQAVSDEPDAFGEADITLAELLVSHTTTAIDRIEREKTLTRKTERLEEFASFVSHDLRNPLNVATLRLELLRDDCDSQHAEGLEDALGRMERLIDELLTLARQGETIGETEPVQLSALATRAWENVETNGATLACETDRTLFADRNRLTAVLENLFRNAVEHGSASDLSGSDGTADRGSTGDSTGSDDAVDDASVTVTVGDLADQTGFYVADDGDGIPESERDQVFESGYSTAEDGTGFGLAIVRDIVEAHDWDIEATESEDGGARFEISGVEFAA